MRRDSFGVQDQHTWRRESSLRTERYRYSARLGLIVDIAANKSASTRLISLVAFLTSAEPQKPIRAFPDPSTRISISAQTASHIQI